MFPGGGTRGYLKSIFGLPEFMLASPLTSTWGHPVYWLRTFIYFANFYDYLLFFFFKFTFDSYNNVTKNKIHISWKRQNSWFGDLTLWWNNLLTMCEAQCGIGCMEVSKAAFQK